MAMNFTQDQQKVIDTRGKNILVSASAGSGKTAVLVARIMKKVCEEGIDIDRLLIVTFTNAAAAEMRERIHNALLERIEEEPENEHLQKQLVLLMNAQITTIHSFCLYLVRNHFEKVDIDPTFRLGDEGEMKLLKNDVLDEMLEEHYSEGTEGFLQMIEALTSSKRDENIKEYILSIYEFAMSYPWPKQWLFDSMKQYNENRLEGSSWFQFVLEDIEKTMWDLEEEVKHALKITQAPDGPYMYEDALKADLELISQIKKAKSYQEKAVVFQNLSYTALSRKRDSGVSEAKKDQVKALREAMKKGLKEVKERYFYESYEVLTGQMEQAGKLVKTLAEFTEEFMERFSKAKREKALVDFNDLEHFAIEILIDEEKKDKEEEKYTEVAKELQEHFEEIMTDEYQDSNLVQEIILTAVSGQSCGKQNMFMVGDVKQGIYRFRLARPELFMEKHDEYIKEEVEESERIDLHKNFRSRDNVIRTVNFMFTQLMRKEFGNIEYDETEALFLGAQYEEKEGMGYETELLLVETKEEEEGKLAEDEEYTKIELEARTIAERIKTFVETEYVYDKGKKCFRKAGYGDMVILLRTMRGYAENIGEVLKEYDIPVMITSRTGYFAAIEVQTVLNMLSIIDNPKQDIPLAAVLTSPIGNLSSLELSMIKGEFKELSFEQAVWKYAKEGSNSKVKEKLNNFSHMLDGLRKIVAYTPIHSLIERVLQDSGYLDYVTAMPAGAQRRGNLEMLIEKAVSYEKTSYSGLFQFIRYMEQLKKYEIDFGEAVSKENADNAVKIMSIHKSKGLEFPIVFLASAHKNFNLQDTRAKICLDLDFGIGIDWYDLEHRVKTPTMLKKVIARKQKLETIAEELRVLYVALTRAEEKLVITGITDDLKKQLQGYETLAGRQENSLSYSMLSKTTSYLEWILQSMYRHKAMKEIQEQYELEQSCGQQLYSDDVLCKVKVYSYGEIIEALKYRNLNNDYMSQTVQIMVKEEELYQKEKEYITKIFTEQYAHEKHENIHSKISVSELKEHAIEEADDIFVEQIFETHKKEPYIPGFIQEKEEKAGGTERGNAYHKIMELTAHRKVENEKELKEMIETLVQEGKISRQYADLLYPPKLMTFFKSDLSERMRKAYEKGKLYREQPFLIGLDVSEVYKKDYKEKETVLIQGIIDAFFEEDGEIVLVDYKTDWIQAPEELKKRYEVQIVQYAQALERLKQRKVKEKAMFSFHLGKKVLL